MADDQDTFTSSMVADIGAHVECRNDPCPFPGCPIHDPDGES